VIHSVENVKATAAILLGDPNARKFTAADLHGSFEIAYLKLTGEMARYQIRKQKTAVVYTLAATTTDLTPATASITNFGELIRLEERASGSTDKYTDVEQVDQLPQRSQESRLSVFEWSGDTFRFVGASQNIQLRITYFDSGAAPASGSLGIDGALPFLAYYTASIRAAPSGNTDLSDRYEKAALGPYRDGGGGFLHEFLQAQIRAEQRVQVQIPCYDSDAATRTAAPASIG
jgi:hypothetical protein